MDKQSSSIEDVVKKRYSGIATLWTENKQSSCCAPDEVNETYSLGCDRRLLDEATPQQGETVIDIGSGAGGDVRRVADLVGSGMVYGVDFSKDMIELAKRQSKDYDNVEFIQSHISDVPLDANIADLIISNCVMNLVEDKSAVFSEIFRLLKSGGRLVLSDMITDEDIPELSESELCACIGGARSIESYIDLMKQAGFTSIEYKTEYKDVYTSQRGEFPYQSVLFTGYKPS